MIQAKIVVAQIRRLTFASVLVGSAVFALDHTENSSATELDAQPALNRDFLLKGCRVDSLTVPERREYPVNPNVNPCQDLYAYACSKTTQGFKLPASRSSWDFPSGEGNELMLCAKKKYLANLGRTSTVPSKRGAALKTFYGACMNAPSAAREEKALVAKELKVTNAAHDVRGFRELTGARADAPEFSFVKFWSTPNLDKPEVNDVVFEPNVMTLPEPSYYDKPDVVADLKKLAENFFRAAGLDHPSERAQSVVDYERAFAKTYPVPDDLRDRGTQRNAVERAKLSADYAGVPLARTLARFPGSTTIRDMFPESMAYMNKSLSNTPVDTLKNVQLFHALKDNMDDAYPKFQAQLFAFNAKHLGGPQKRPDRAERCTKKVMNDFGMELDAEVLPILFPNFPQEKVVQLVDSVRGSILKGLKNNQWLSAQGKAAAIKKISTAQLYLVQPNTEKEWNFAPPATYMPDQPYANERLLNKNLIDKQIHELSEPRDRSRWDMDPLTVNAYYSREDNKFVLPIGTLQYPFFDASMSTTSNLAGIGSTIGHELGHGIDDKGAQYDDKGRLHQWMTDQDVKHFQALGDKIVDQFNRAGYNGKLTEGENLADLNGLIVAYDAAFPDGKGAQKDKKDFFVAYARTWCFTMSPSYRELLMKTDEHALGEARTNEPSKHLAGFSEAFGCKAGDAMYLPPAKRVRIW